MDGVVEIGLLKKCVGVWGRIGLVDGWMKDHMLRLNGFLTDGLRYGYSHSFGLFL